MSYQVDISKNSHFEPSHPVTFLGTNQKPITVPDVLSDTGTGTTSLELKYARAMGIDLTKTKTVEDTLSSAGQGTLTSFKTQIYVRIGNLKPVLTDVNFGDTGGFNLLGRSTLNKFKIRYTWEKQTILN